MNESVNETVVGEKLTADDLLLYGYAYEGMSPLSRDQALELYDSGAAVYLLYPDDTEALADSRERIETFDGMFGVENGLYANRGDVKEYHLPIELFLACANPTGREAVRVERLRLPTERGEAYAVMSDIGAVLDDPTTYRITAFHAEEPIKAYITKSESIDELNMLAEYLHFMEDWETNKFEAILQSGLAKTNCVADLINILDSDNMDSFELIPAQNALDLGRYWQEENPDAVPEGMGCEEYGRLCAREEQGVFTEFGYIYRRFDAPEKSYKGVVPEGCRLTKDRPSVLEQIREAQKKPAPPAKPKPERGGHDMDR